MVYEICIAQSGDAKGTRRVLVACVFLACSLALAGLPSPAAAQTSYRSALPGAGRLRLLDTPRSIATVSLGAGYGFTESVLGTDDTHHRIAGGLAVGVHPASWLSVALSLEGRLDKHSGTLGGSSAVGDPRIHLLFRLPEMGDLRLGLAIDLWAPGGDAPSIDFGALSPTATLVAQYRLDDLRLAARVGYAHDRSAETLDSGPVYQPGDQVSLGVTAADAIEVGLGASYTLDPLTIFGEVSADILVGRDAGVPGSATRARIELGASAQVHDRVEVGGVASVYLAGRPQVAIDQSAPFRVEPRLDVRAYLAIALGTLDGADTEDPVEDGDGLSGTVLDEEGEPVADARVLVRRADPDGTVPPDAPVVSEGRTDAEGEFSFPDLEEDAYELEVQAEGRAPMRLFVASGDETPPIRLEGQSAPPTSSRTLTGRVLAPNGDPLPAHITVRQGERVVGEVEADADGNYSVPDLPAGELQVTIDAEGRETEEFDVGAGVAQVDPVEMQAALPEGEIRVSVHGRGSDPVDATVRIEPGAVEADRTDEGRYELHVAPGRYVVHIEADGYRPQQRRVVVEEDGVTVLEVHLRSR